jgi:hypothetical protein
MRRDAALLFAVLTVGLGCSVDHQPIGGDGADGASLGTDSATDASSASDGTVDGSADAPADTSFADDIGDSNLDRADGVPEVWTPRDLSPALALWLDDTSGIAITPDGQGTWADQSGRIPAHNARCMQPGSVGLDSKAINGLDAVKLTGGLDTAGMFIGGPLATAEWSLAFVVRAIGRGGTIWYREGASDTPSDLNTDSFFAVGVVASTPADGGPSQGSYLAQFQPDRPIPTIYSVMTSGRNYLDGQFHVVIVRVSTEAIELRVDGDAPISIYCDCRPSGLSGLPYLGGVIGVALPGDIAEVIGVDGTFSDDEVAHLDKYFSAKFGLP